MLAPDAGGLARVQIWILTCLVWLSATRDFAAVGRDPRPATLIFVDGHHPGIADLTDTPVPCRVPDSRTEPHPRSLATRQPPPRRLPRTSPTLATRQQHPCRPLPSPPPPATRQPPLCRPLPSPGGGHDRSVSGARAVGFVDPAVKSETGGRAQLERISGSRARHSYGQSSLYLARWP